MTAHDPHPEELADAFFTVAHALKRTVNARSHHSGMSLARLRALWNLIERGAVRMGELSQCVDVAPRTMTSTVDAMERDGLVRRERDPDDGRATIVHITDAGRAAFDEARRTQARTVVDMFDALDLRQRVTLAEILERLGAATAAAEEHQRTAAPTPASMPTPTPVPLPTGR
ncbi:MAG TPA: MarR family transcriptional regulator [Acidimicrobiales bacterium]|nr:MarR family transcriptional regulator [Acidimicrobiales bacterium]